MIQDSKLAIARVPRERYDIAYIFNPRTKHDHALEAQPKAGMWHCAELPQVPVPPVILNVKPFDAHRIFQNV